MSLLSNLQPEKKKTSGTIIDTIETGKKDWRGITHERKAKTEDVIEKRAHWSDKTLPNMCLDSEYICHIIRGTDAKNRETIEYDWRVIPGTGNKYPISYYYVDSDGNLSLHAKVGDSYVSQSIPHDEYLAKTDKITETATVSTRRSQSSINKDGLVEICTLSYGAWNAIFKNATYEGHTLTDYVTYDRRDHPFIKPNGKEGIKYEGALLCLPDSLAFWTKAVKHLGKDNKSIIYNN